MLAPFLRTLQPQNRSQDHPEKQQSQLQYDEELCSLKPSIIPALATCMVSKVGDGNGTVYLDQQSRNFEP